MSIFKDTEKRLENLFEGFFAKRFRTALQPVELARKLMAEMDRGRQISVTFTYAPNIYTVALASKDLAEIERFRESLLRELTKHLAAHAQDKKYHLTGPIEVTFAAEPRLRSGDCLIDSHIEEKSAVAVEEHTQIISAEEARKLFAATQSAKLDDKESGLSYPLESASITIGRQADNDIVLNNPGVSRRHARLDLEEKTYHLIDLDSTNGTYVNEKEIDRASLADGDRIRFGNIVLTFRLNCD